ncbi:MAG TPA: sigma-70 family RNA polymerase sigma factor [Actinomycetota bacterium]|nr:sigma-70 family RNA polymerase sigma factor [Actinomycetota bacterium]
MTESEGASTTYHLGSFEEFFGSERDELFATLCLVTRDRHEAEELTQEAFVRVLERWERVSGLENPRGYLYRTAMNVFRSRYRRTLVAAKRALRITPPDDGIVEVEERDTAMRALAPLSPRQRAAVVLTDLLGFPSDEAARMLGIRASTLRMHASRAHAALRKGMSHE